MNSIVRLFNIIFGLGDSLERTKELVDQHNVRLAQSLGLDRPQVKLLDVSPPAGNDVSPVDRQDTSPAAADDASENSNKRRRPVKAVA